MKVPEDGDDVTVDEQIERELQGFKEDREKHQSTLSEAVVTHQSRVRKSIAIYGAKKTRPPKKDR